MCNLNPYYIYIYIYIHTYILGFVSLFPIIVTKLKKHGAWMSYRVKKQINA